MIIYASICRMRDAAVLVEVVAPDLKGNASHAMSQLLQHLRDHPEIHNEGERKTYVHRNTAEDDFFSHFIEACATAMGDESVLEEHYFHVYRHDDVFYACLGDDPQLREQKVNFAFLEQVKMEFTKLYRPAKINTAHAYSLDKNFGPTLRSALHYHNLNHVQLSRDEKVQALMTQVQDMKQVVGRNIHVLLDRGEDLEKLMDKSQIMKEDAVVFQKKSVKFVRKERYRHAWLIFLSTVVVVLLLYLAVLGVCGFGLKECRRFRNGNGNSSSGNGYSSGGSSSSGGN